MPIAIDNLTYTYGRRTPYQKTALDNVSLTIEDGEFFGIIGHTGCGKSTLVGHLNGLERVQSGSIAIDDIVLNYKKPKKRLLRQLRQKVGMVFQYPEHQLFADTVLLDVSFGPKNLGLEKQEVFDRAKQAIELVGLDFEAVKDRSIFELSGGQKRRVAIAGVLAMRPQILVLDEPTSGLDPKGKKEILDLVVSIKESMCKTVIMISHNMDEVASLANRIAVISKGKVVCVKTPKELFGVREELKELNIAMPNPTMLANELADRGLSIARDIVDEDELVSAILTLAEKGCDVHKRAVCGLVGDVKSTSFAPKPPFRTPDTPFEPACSSEEQLKGGISND